MIVFFRVDASTKIGMGHLMRCRAIALELKNRGCKVVFIMKISIKLIIDMLESFGFHLHVLSDDLSDWSEDAKRVIDIISAYSENDRIMFVDHYQLFSGWESLVKKHVKKLISIVDQPGQKHSSDVLIDQTYGRSIDFYQDCVDDSCQLLLGSKYALLAEAFQQYRIVAYDRRKNNKSVSRVLISFGGSDRKNLTMQALVNLCKKGRYQYDVVLGVTAAHFSSIKKITERYHECMTLHFNSKNISKLMYEADIAIGAAGSSSWERCCLSLPTLTLALVDNQKDILTALIENNAAFDIGQDGRLDCEKLEDCFNYIVSNKKQRLEMAANAQKLCDGGGVTRVIEALNVF